MTERRVMAAIEELRITYAGELALGAALDKREIAKRAGVSLATLYRVENISNLLSAGPPPTKAVALKQSKRLAAALAKIEALTAERDAQIILIRQLTGNLDVDSGRALDKDLATAALLPTRRSD